jgi:hypothetical protein
MNTTTTSIPQLRIVSKKGADGLDYVTVSTVETRREKFQRIATKVGEAIDRVVFYSGADFAHYERPKH